MTAVEETRANFTHDCLLDPWDDTPRLVFADFLDEHGEEDRAELVRMQVELERHGKYVAPPEILEIANSGRVYAQAAIDLITEKAREHNGKDDLLRRREKDILTRHTGDKATGERWDRVKCGKCDGNGSYNRGIWTTRISCSVCGGSGDLALRRCQTCEGRGRFCSGECRGSGYVARSQHWDRGFLHLGCEIAEAVEERECPCTGGDSPIDDCGICSGTGRIPTLTAWGRAVVDSGCGLWLEGVEPTQVIDLKWTWASERLPNWLWELCKDRFDSSDAAVLSLARAFTSWATRQAWEVGNSIPKVTARA